MSKPITDQDLTEIRKRIERATPGPWDADVFTEEEGPVVLSDAPEFGNDDALKHIVGGASKNEDIDFPTGLAWDDAEFIAHARTDLQRLLEEVSRLKASVKDAYTDGFEDGADEYEGWVTCEYQYGRPSVNDFWPQSKTFKSLQQ